MHDHATDGGRRAFEATATAYALRLHLDNAHDLRTNGAGYDHLAEMHRGRHAEEDARLAEIEAAANLIGERLAAASGAVAESIVADDTDRLYHDLHAARERLCQAQTLLVDTALGRHARGNLGRAIHLIDAVGAQWCPDQWSRFDQSAEQPTVVDLMEALEESLAKAKRTLGKTSGTTQPPDRHGEADGPAAVAPHATPSSTAAPSLLRDGEATGAAVDPAVGGGEPVATMASRGRPTPSGSIRSGGAS